MVITYSRVRINRARLPILLVVSWTGKMNISLSRPRTRLRIWPRETGSHGIPPDFPRRPIYIFKPPYAIGSVPSLSGHAIAYRWRSLPRARRHWGTINSLQGSSSNGCCYVAGHHGPINVRLSLPTPGHVDRRGNIRVRSWLIFPVRTASRSPR